MRKFGKMGIKSEDITIISEKSSLEGKLEVPGNVLIQGAFKGSIISRTLEIFKNAKGRFIPCTAEVVWSDERNLSDQRKFLGIGVRFTRMTLHDRAFLHREISNRT